MNISKLIWHRLIQFSFFFQTTHNAVFYQTLYFLYSVQVIANFSFLFYISDCQMCWYNFMKPQLNRHRVIHINVTVYDFYWNTCLHYYVLGIIYLMYMGRISLSSNSYMYSIDSKMSVLVVMKLCKMFLPILT